MRLSAAPSDLRRRTEAHVDLFVGVVFDDERPFRGMVGQLSYRLAGRLDHLALAGFVTGERGEASLLGGGKRLPFPRVLLVGAGALGSLDGAALREATAQVIDRSAKLLARSLAVELPGRAYGATTIDTALDAFFEQPWTDAGAFDEIVIIDHEDRKVDERLVRTRRF